MKQNFAPCFIQLKLPFCLLLYSYYKQIPELNYLHMQLLVAKAYTIVYIELTILPFSICNGTCKS